MRRPLLSLAFLLAAGIAGEAHGQKLEEFRFKRKALPPVPDVDCRSKEGAFQKTLEDLGNPRDNFWRISLPEEVSPEVASRRFDQSPDDSEYLLNFYNGQQNGRIAVTRKRLGPLITGLLPKNLGELNGKTFLVDDWAHEPFDAFDLCLLQLVHKGEYIPPKAEELYDAFARALWESLEHQERRPPDFLSYDNQTVAKAFDSLFQPNANPALRKIKEESLKDLQDRLQKLAAAGGASARLMEDTERSWVGGRPAAKLLAIRRVEPGPSGGAAPWETSMSFILMPARSGDFLIAFPMFERYIPGDFVYESAAKALAEPELVTPTFTGIPREQIERAFRGAFSEDPSGSFKLRQDWFEWFRAKVIEYGGNGPNPRKLNLIQVGADRAREKPVAYFRLREGGELILTGEKNGVKSYVVGQLKMNLSLSGSGPPVIFYQTLPIEDE